MEDVKLSIDQATAIIAEAKNADAFTDPMPVDEAERLAEAKNLYSHAARAARLGNKHKVVSAIMAIAHGDDLPEISEVEETQQVEEQKLDLDFVVYEETAENVEPTGADREDPAPKLEIDKFLQKEKLPIPAEPDWEIKPIPSDLTLLSDAEVRKLHGEYHAYFSRAAWLLVQEENDLHAAEHLHGIAMARAIKEIGGDKITAAKNEAASDEEVVKWKEKMLEHGANAKKLKTLVTIYDSSCNRLSREWTMRSEERGTSGNLFNNR